MNLVIAPDGTVRCIYSETIDLKQFGQIQVRRASTVEPDKQGQWSADLSPVGGPVLGPYPRRSDALAAEGVWLDEELISNVTDARSDAG